MPRELFRAPSRFQLTRLEAIGLFVFAAFALYRAWAVLLPLALAILLTLAFARLLLGVYRRGSEPAPAVLLVVSAALLMFAAVGFVLCQEVIHLTRGLPEKIEQIRAGIAR